LKKFTMYDDEGRQVMAIAHMALWARWAKNCLYYKKQQLKRWNDKQLVLITVILRSKNIFSSLESFQRLHLLNTHLVNFKFVFFCWQEIRSQQLDRYRYNLWYILDIYFLVSNFHTLSYNNCLKIIMIKSNYIQFF
jgi:hypothetical protein